MDASKVSQYQDVLVHSALFRGLDPAVLQPILNKALVLEGKAGDLVYYENMRGGIGLHMVLDGEVEVFRTDAAGGTPEHLNTLKPGDFFGEYSLIDELNTSASARAITDTRMLFIPRGQFMQLVDSDAKVGKQVYRNLLLHLVTRLRKS